ncbi:MAG TPA: hypothetical protein VLM38_04980 [Blastocatellia bacterium]|nr:hypothetical protein [Blastocatellia bacterium]
MNTNLASLDRLRTLKGREFGFLSLRSFPATRHLCVLVLMLTLCPVAFAQTQSSFVDLVRRSGFIFQGTVKAIGESTPTVVRERNTAIVTVDRVVESLPPAGNPTGRDVTVRLRTPGEIRPGQKATFFTYVYSAGKSLGLDEVGILPIEDSKTLEDRVRAARQTLADEALTARLRRAEMVVVGVVGEARPTEEARNPGSEHDPLWWRAPITVRSFEKGQRPRGPIIVNIAMNFDYLWALAPKPKAGEEGIFLLQADREKQFRVSGFFLIDALDALPISELERVRRLIK